MTKISICQSSTLRDTDWWDWAVWLEGPDSALETIERVIYRLHPTFPNPTRVIRDSASGFRLRSAGWGEFTILIEIHYGDDRVERRTHELRLEDRAPDDERESRPLKIFMCFSLADSKLASDLQSSLAARNVAVSSGSEIPVGEDWKSSLKANIAASDAVIAILSDASSSLVELERGYAAEADIPMFSVVVGDRQATRRGGPREEIIRLPDGTEIEAVVAQIEKRIGKAFSKKVGKSSQDRPQPRSPKHPGKRH
jgi:hypothetical protein